MEQEEDTGRQEVAQPCWPGVLTHSQEPNFLGQGPGPDLMSRTTDSLETSHHSVREGVALS